MSLSQVHG
ncbi:rCG58960 [Rattus norvegicus]|uniref:RCG58960 n=1 Tax=Rattus norvegicus TaxID=10116 RepID=A6KQ58_RAT|nr:rCG58960 [Rattus norvegicus]